MRKTFSPLLAFFFSLSSILPAHVVDIHIPTADDIWNDQKREEEEETKKDWETYEDEDATDEERYEAMERLLDKGEIS